MPTTHITIIGAGSAIFGLNTMAAIVGSKRLRGSRLALVDRNPEALDLMRRLATRLNREWDAQMTLTAHTHHAEGLDGAEFIVLAIEVPPREALWQMDYQIPLKYGVRQPYAENGGPGGFAHAARNIGPVMEIVHDMERICPNAWLINFTNPMMRICDAVRRYSSVRVVGLCHQIGAGYAMVGYALAGDLGLDVPEGFTGTHASPSVIPSLVQMAALAQERLDIKAAGLNHFTWMLDVRDRQTGQDLYPLFAERWRALDPNFEPLTRRVYDAFGLFPIPGDEHLCEYLPWVSDPLTKPWEKYEITLYEWDVWAGLRDLGHRGIAGLADGRMPVDDLRDADSEGVLEIIEAITGAHNDYHQAVNLPNQGLITNLPAEAIVEVPGLVTGTGVRGVSMGPLPGGIAELCRREIAVVRLCVDAAVHGDRQAALQCLLLDPVITDLDVARLVLDDYLAAYREHLPQFWA